MYNQVNHGPHNPMQPAYQQRPQAQPPRFQFQQASPAPPGQHVPHMYMQGPPGSSSFVQNTGQSYVIPRTPMHGNSLMPHVFPGFGQNSQHSSNLGVITHHIHPSGPPPHSNPRHEVSWTPGPSPRVLPPPPPPPPTSSQSQGQHMYRHPVPPCPPPPGDVQSLQHIPPPPPAPSTSGFRASSSDNPPLPSCPPPSMPSPPPSNSPMTSASNLDVSNLPHDLHSDPKSSMLHASVLKTVDSADKIVGSDIFRFAAFPKESGVSKEAAIAESDGLSGTTNAISDLPPPPCRPTEDKIVEKIEALCWLIVENGPDFENKILHDERENPEYAFLFGGDPGSEAAISHEYFLWMKRKFILEHRWHAKKSEVLSRPLAVDSLRDHEHLNVVTERNSATDSDMEMEDDITFSDKDQGLNNETEVLNQPHDKAIEIGSKNLTHQLQNSIGNNPPNDTTCSIPLGARNTSEVLEHSFKSEEMSTAAPQADDLTDYDASKPDRDSGQLKRSGSPMKLLQDYASDGTSDNEDESYFANASTVTVSATATTSASVTHIDLGSYLGTDTGSKISSATQKGRELLSNTLPNELNISLHLVRDGDVAPTTVASGTNDVCDGRNLENQASVNFTDSIEDSKGKYVLSGAGIDSSHKSGNAEQGNKKSSKYESNPSKVDKFGRVSREDPIDSDSDDSRNHRSRRRNKRDRSWSHSLSPIERSGRRRKRSPWRRKDKRSRSRSRSPRNRRSRSRGRSPILRRSGEFNENKTRDKGKCFDFLRGRCYRGASCRYLHHEPEKNAISRHHRNKRDLEVSSKNYRSHEAKKSISEKVSGDECERVKSRDVLSSQKVSGSSTDQEVEQRKEEDSVKIAIVSTLSDHCSQLVNVSPTGSSREFAPEVREPLATAEELKTIICDNEASSSKQLLVGGLPSNSISSGGALKPSDSASQDVFSSENGSSVQLLQSNVSVGMQGHSDHPSQIINNSIVSNLLPDGNRLTASSSEISNSKPLPCTLPSTQLQSTSILTSQHLLSDHTPLGSQASKELLVHGSVGFPPHSHQLPLPPSLPPHSYSSVQPQMFRDYYSMQQNIPFPYQSTRREPYPRIWHAPNPQFCAPPNNSWTSLPLSLPPPPPPLQPQFGYNSSLNSGAPTSYVSFDSNEKKLHLGTDFVSHTSATTGQPSHIQGVESQDQAYARTQEHSQPLTHVETFPSKALSQGNLVSQSPSDLKVGEEDHNKQLPGHDSKSVSSPSFASLQSQPKPFSMESDVNRLQPSSYRLPPEDFKAATFIHPLSQKQQTVYGSHISASDGNLDVHGKAVTASRYPPDVFDGNHSASLPEFGGSRISAHYNPYASTFEQPLSSKFNSSIFRREKDTIHINNYGPSSSFHPDPVNGQGVYGVGSRQTTSPESARVIGQKLPRSDSDQYDPLFDSIEPSSASLKKPHLDLKQEVTGESNVSLRRKSSFKSLDVEENKQWEVDATASTSSQNNDEYGETADAEVGAVENESLSNPVDSAKMATGEIEIDQVESSPGKRKKSKDSRSMKLFKVSIANFVKEVLKPSWRQGNMSKVAFKTIVKKTVDKVSGAIKGHRVPKSQEKINQYIDSSQRKLTKLVMGYVDKYVKV